MSKKKKNLRPHEQRQWDAEHPDPTKQIRSTAWYWDIPKNLIITKKSDRTLFLKHHSFATCDFEWTRNRETNNGWHYVTNLHEDILANLVVMSNRQQWKLMAHIWTWEIYDKEKNEYIDLFYSFPKKQQRLLLTYAEPRDIILYRQNEEERKRGWQ